MLTQLVSLLPEKLQDKAKAVVAVLGVVVGAVVQATPSHPAWVDVAIAVLTALGVYVTPNIDKNAPGKA